VPRKTPPAQLDREINAVLKQPRAKSGKSTKTIDGYKVTIIDFKTLGSARFAAYYDLLPAHVSGRGATKAEAITDLKRVAADYGKRRQDEIEREDYAQHEADKERMLRDGDY
jgi:hypothetical protein